MVTINFLTPSSKPSKDLNIFPRNLTIGVTASRNAFPIGAIESLRFSIDALKFVPTASSTFFISRSERIASSSILAFVKPSTRFAWLPCFVIF